MIQKKPAFPFLWLYFHTVDQLLSNPVIHHAQHSWALSITMNILKWCFSVMLCSLKSPSQKRYYFHSEYNASHKHQPHVVLGHHTTLLTQALCKSNSAPSTTSGHQTDTLSFFKEFPLVWEWRCNFRMTVSKWKVKVFPSSSLFWLSRHWSIAESEVFYTVCQNDALPTQAFSLRQR